MTGAGSILLNYPEREPDELDPRFSCSLDVADRGAVTFEEVGVLLQLSRERIRQIEERALPRMQRRLRVQGFSFEDLTFEPPEAPPGDDLSGIGGASSAIRAHPMGKSTVRWGRNPGTPEQMKARMAHAREVAAKNREEMSPEAREAQRQRKIESLVKARAAKKRPG